jgi:L-alanine-DL-glutamate epimerase-like enolase superfamily enzyme
LKITGSEIWLFEPRQDHSQEVPAYKNREKRDLGLLRVFTDEGITGELTWTGAALRAFASRWRACRPFFPLEGQDPFDNARIDRVLTRRFYWPIEQRGILDTILWDIKGKAVGKPIYKVLGATREKVLAYGSTVHHGSDKRFIQTALACQKKGYTALKIHPYCSANEDIRLCRAVRKAVGDDFTLMLDPLIYPAPYTREEALRVGRVLDELNFWWYEDPLPKDDLQGLMELRNACQIVQIRSGDRVASIHEYPARILKGCIDIMAGPLTFGISHLIQLAHLAEANYMNMEPHNYTGFSKSLHVLLAVNNAKYYEKHVPEGSLDTLMYPNVWKDTIKVDAEGFVHAPSKPGLGFAIDLEAARKVTVEQLKP